LSLSENQVSHLGIKTVGRFSVEFVKMWGFV